MTYVLKKTRRLLLLASLLVMIVPAVAAAETYYLRAAETTIDLPGVGPVPMWGYALDADNNFATVDGTVTVPGPELRVTGAGDLTVVLHNDLPEPTSIVIGAQSMPDTGANPQEFSDGSRLRMRSLTLEAAANGGEQSYTWTGLQPGTYLYHSGTHMSVQPSMGLYGATIYDDGAYPGQTFDTELTLLFSEVDVDEHNAVAGGTYGTTAYPTAMYVGYETDFFLLNGKSYTPDQVPTAVNAGDRILLRMLNAGLRSRVPTVPGLAMDVVADDGHPYVQALVQSGVNLPPQKTMDALITAPATAGYVPIFDRRLGLHDLTNSSKGMITYLAVSDGGATFPLTVDLINAGAGDRVFMTSSPGGIDCPGDCTEAALIDGTGITLNSTAGPGSALFAWRVFDGDPAGGGVRIDDACADLSYCPIDMTAARWVEAEFKSYNKVSIVAPNASSVLTPGAHYNIRWAAPATAETFDVAYNLGPGTPWITIASGISDLYAQWHIPAEATSRGNPRLSVVGYNALNQVDSSDMTTFKINLQDQITLTYPNGGEILTGGNIATITWSQLVASSPVATISLQYQSAAGTAWQPIATIDTSVTPDPGQYDWTVPILPLNTADARVGIMLYDALGKVLVQDVSNAPFTIDSPLDATPLGFAIQTAAAPAAVAPPLQLLLPNGGEHILVENGFTVLWESTFADASYSIALSTNQGESWTELASGVTGSQYDWQIAPELAGSQALLKITALDAEGKELGSDTSDEAFVLE